MFDRAFKLVLLAITGTIVYLLSIELHTWTLALKSIAESLQQIAWKL